MLHFEVNHERCLRSQGIDCRNCVWACPMNVLGIKTNRVTMNPDLLQKDCIFCTSCLGACLIDHNVIKVWDDENPQLTHTPTVLQKIVQLEEILMKG